MLVYIFVINHSLDFYFMLQCVECTDGQTTSDRLP